MDAIKMLASSEETDQRQAHIRMQQGREALRVQRAVAGRLRRRSLHLAGRVAQPPVTVDLQAVAMLLFLALSFALAWWLDLR